MPRVGATTVRSGKRRVAIAAAAIAIMFAGNAGAADSVVPTKAAPVPYAVPSAFDWSGFYAGGHVAYGQGGASSTLSNPNPSGVGNSFSSLYGGLQAGYNYVLPSRLLLGLEADISFPNFLEDGFIAGRATALGTNVTDQIDY